MWKGGEKMGTKTPILAASDLLITKQPAGTKIQKSERGQQNISKFKNLLKDTQITENKKFLRQMSKRQDEEQVFRSGKPIKNSNSKEDIKSETEQQFFPYFLEQFNAGSFGQTLNNCLELIDSIEQISLSKGAVQDSLSWLELSLGQTFEQLDSVQVQEELDFEKILAESSQVRKQPDAELNNANTLFPDFDDLRFQENQLLKWTAKQCLQTENAVSTGEIIPAVEELQTTMDISLSGFEENSAEYDGKKEKDLAGELSAIKIKDKQLDFVEMEQNFHADLKFQNCLELGYGEKIENIRTESEQKLTDSILKQVVKHSRVFAKEDLTRMEIKLKPDNLGRLVLQLVVEKGVVSAKFTVENQTVKKALQENFEVLKHNLKQQGIVTDKLTVNVNEQTSSYLGQDGFFEGQTGSKWKREDNNRHLFQDEQEKMNNYEFDSLLPEITGLDGGLDYII